MKFLLKFSFLNMWRNPKRTIVLLFGLSITNALVLWGYNLTQSTNTEIIKDITNGFIGTEQLTKKGMYTDFMRKMDTYHFLFDQDLSPQILNRSDVTKRIMIGAFLSGEKKGLGTYLVGIDPVTEGPLSTLRNVVKLGRFVNNDELNPVVIGKKMANILQVKIGDQIVAVGQGVDGSIANDLFTIVGLFDFGGAELEERLAVTNISSARNFISMPPLSFHSITKFGNGPTLGTLPKLELFSWRDMAPSLAVSMDFMDVFNGLTTTVINFVICLGMANTVMISFLERKKEIITLNVIGASYKWITLSMAMEILCLTVLSILIGNILGLLLSWYCNIHPINISMFSGGKPIIQGGMVLYPKVRVQIFPFNIVKSNLLLFGFMLIAMIYPLWSVIQRSKRAN